MSRKFQVRIIWGRAGSSGIGQSVSGAWAGSSGLGSDHPGVDSAEQAGRPDHPAYGRIIRPV